MAKENKLRLSENQRKSPKILSSKPDVKTETNEQGATNSNHMNGPILRSRAKTNLADWDLPQAVVEAYAEKGIDTLFDWQSECLAIGDVMNGGNLVYSAPTSAGKTMVAEILVLKKVLEGKKKALLILPFVSIAREKMFYLQSLFQNVGVRVDGYMGSHNPPGGFASVDVAVCTIEKANGLVNRLLEEDKLDQLGILVVDELHMVGDAGRGYLLELLLTKVLYTASSKRVENATQIVGMSATLPNLDVLASWLKADLYRTDFRPVPLEEFIKIGQDIYDASRNDAPLVRKLPKYVLSSTGKEDVDHVIYLCLETITKGNSVLVFCPAKQWCEKLAENIAREIYEIGRPGNDKDKSELAKEWGLQLRSRLNGPKLSDVCEQLKSCPAGLDATLSLTISFGVAFHHAGLTFDERDIIEGAYRSGRVKVLVATTTLSSGVNLPARRVIIRSPLARGQSLDVLCYKQMVGRAGRKGVDTKGESILLCKETERKLAFKLIRSSPNPVESCLIRSNSSEALLSSSLKRAILEAIASDAVTSPEEVELYASCTLLATQLANEIEGSLAKDRTKGAVNLCIDYLTDNEFIYLRKINKDGVDDVRYAPSRLGKAVLSSSLSPDEALSLLRELKKARKCFVMENELHLVYQVTPPFLMDQLSSSINWMEYLSLWDDLALDMKKVGELVGVEERFLANAIGGVNRAQSGQALAVHSRFYAALALHDLVREVKFNKVVEKYKIAKGVLQSLQQSAATFSGMVGAFCDRLGWKNMELLIKQFQQRLYFGVRRELCDLLRLSTLDARMARVLYDAGYEMPSNLARADPVDIEIVLKNAKPFRSEKKRDEDDEAECVWMTGMKGVTERKAAQLMVKEAQFMVEKDLGVEKINWNIKKGGNRQETPSNSSAMVFENEKRATKRLKINESTPPLLLPKIPRLENAPVSELKRNDSRTMTRSTTKVITPLIEDASSNNHSVFRFSDSIELPFDQTSTPLLPNAPKIQLTVKTFSKAISKLATANNDVVTVTNFVHAVKEISKRLPAKMSIPSTNEKAINEFRDLNLSMGSDFSEEEIITSDEKRASYRCSEDIFASPLLRVRKKSPNIDRVDQKMPSQSKKETKVDQRLGKSVTTEMNPIGDRGRNSFLETRPDESLERTPIIERLNGRKTNLMESVESAFSPSYLSNNSPVSREANFGSSNVSRENSDVNDLDVSHDLFNDESEISESSRVDSPKNHLNLALFGSEGFELAPSQDDVLDDHATKNRDENHSKVDASKLYGDSIFELSSETNAKFVSTKNVDESDKKIEKNVNIGAQSSILNDLDGDIFNESFDQSETGNSKKNDSLLTRSVLSDDSFNAFLLKNQPFDDDSFTIAPTPNPPNLKSTKSSLRSSRLDHSQVQTGVRTRSQKAALISDSKRDSQCTGDGICVIDVTSTPELFRVFLDEWKSQDSFSLSIARDKRRTGTPPLIDDHYILDGNSLTEDESVVGFSVCWGSKDAYYVSIKDSPEESRSSSLIGQDELTNVLYEALKDNHNDRVSIGIFDAKAQLNVLSRVDDSKSERIAKLLATSRFDCVDPKVGEWLTDPGAKEKTLHSLVVNYLPQHVASLSVLSGVYGSGSLGITRSNEDGPRLRSALESVLVFHLINLILRKLEEIGSRRAFLEIEMPALIVLSGMDECGIGYDRSLGSEQRRRLSSHLVSLEKLAFKLAKRSFNLISPVDVSKVLYKELRLANPNSGTGKEALDRLKDIHPLPAVILEWRRVSCAVNKVLNQLLVSAKEHPKWRMDRIRGESLTLTATGRISMKEPNIQNIPKDFEITPVDGQDSLDGDRAETFSLRDAFVPYEGGIFLSADYSQLELRILAYLSDEPELKGILNSGDDVFISIAARWLDIEKENVTKLQRQRAKQVCYGVIYGIGYESLAEQLRVEPSQAKDFLHSFHQNYPIIRPYLTSVIEKCRLDGYVETIFGRRRYLPSINSGNSGRRSAAERQAANTRVQGSAADLVKKAMVKIHRDVNCFTRQRLRENDINDVTTVNLVLQLHDELIYEVPARWLTGVAKIVKDDMEGVAPPGIILPVNIKKGRAWGTLHPFTSAD